MYAASFWDPLLLHNGMVLLDGALATELESRGAQLNDALWSARLLATQPALIRTVHADYLRAGAQVITTASYQASFEGFAANGYCAAEAEQLMRLSVTLALQARADVMAAVPAGTPLPLVAASIGPYGASLADGSEYRGDYGLSVTQLMDFHRPRLAVLAGSGADLLACETIPCLAEGLALVKVLKEFPGIKAWLSFSCKNDRQVCHGEAFEQCAALANENEQVVAVGVNCTPPRYVESLVRLATSATRKLILAYPNKGETWDAVHKCWLPGTDAFHFATAALRWYQVGARLIGGCCRTTPQDIAAVRTAFAALPEQF